jgi:hypothetical protein
MMDIGALQYGGWDVGALQYMGSGPVEDDYTGSLNEQLQIYGQFRGDFRINSTLHSSITINSNLQGGYTPPATTGDLKMEILIHGQFGGSYTASLDHILVKPSNVKVAIGKTKQLSVIGYDVYGNVIQIVDIITWSTDAEHGSISETGLFTAGDTAEECTVTATVGEISDSVNIKVVEKLMVGSNRINVKVKVGF